MTNEYIKKILPLYSSLIILDLIFNNLIDATATYHVIQAGRGRGLAELIRHLSHLSLSGWLYLVGCGILSYCFFWGFNALCPVILRRLTSYKYPDFNWLVFPKYTKWLSVLVFLIPFCFVGYFGNEEGDVSFFKFSGVIWIIVVFMSIFPWLFKRPCFLNYHGRILYSTFALGLRYKPLEFNTVDIILLPKAVEKYNDRWKIIDNNGDKICIIEPAIYSNKAQKYIEYIIEQIKNNHPEYK